MADPLDTPVSVAPHNRVSATHAPGVPTRACSEKRCAAHTSDWREKPGSPANTHRIRPELQVVTLRAALETPFRSEAHLSGYVLTREGKPLERSPRIAKDSLPWLREQGFEVYTTCLLADWDTPDHVPWTLELLADFHELCASVPLLATAGVYLSPRGARLVQPLSRWLPVEEGEASLQGWLAALVAAGLPQDLLVVKDWTRLMRTPRHHRDSRDVAPLWESYERLAAIEPPAPAPCEAPGRPRRCSPRPAGLAVLPVFTEQVPPGWAEVADAVGAAIRDTVRSDWRRCYLALSGALLARGLDPAALPAVVARAHLTDPAWAHLTADRVDIARGTALRAAGGLEVTGYHALRQGWPGVADALDATTADGAEARVLRQLAEPARVPVTMEGAREALRAALAEPYGVLAIKAPPGVGKTTAAVERVLALPPPAARARPGSRWAYSAPTHKLALQVHGKLPGRSLHRFGPLSHTQPDGSWTCQYHDAAEALARGGQSVGAEFCKGRGKEACEHFDSCPAREGREGADPASLVVGPHSLLPELSAWAGPAGALVIDEPEEPTVTERLTAEDFDAARRYLDAFVPRYAEAMAPALAAFEAWVGELAAVEGEPVQVREAVRLGASRVVTDVLEGLTGAQLGDSVLEAAQSAVLEDAKSPAPPLRWTEVRHARTRPEHALCLGSASRVLDVLYRAITAEPPWTARVDERGGERAATLVGIHAPLARALRRDGPVVVLDANADLVLPALAKVLGFEPRLVDLHVVDGCPVERAVIATGGATRSRWLPRGVPAWDAILPALRAALAWAARVPGCRVGLITWETLEIALQASLTPEATEPWERWKARGLTRKSLVAATELLRPVLAASGLRIVLGHYGGLEGLDFMADCDCTITLGDPRQNLGEVTDRAVFLGLDPDGRIGQLARAELEQAHGRLRTIHRTRPGRQLHVGALLPGGWQGLPVQVQRLPAGRPRNTAEMTAQEFRQAREGAGMGVREMARALGVGHQTVLRYEAGERPVPADVAAGARALAKSGPEKAIKESSLARSFGTTIHAQGVSGPPPLQGVSGPPGRPKATPAPRGAA